MATFSPRITGSVLNIWHECRRIVENVSSVGSYDSRTMSDTSVSSLRSTGPPLVEASCRGSKNQSYRLRDVYITRCQSENEMLSRFITVPWQAFPPVQWLSVGFAFWKIPRLNFAHGNFCAIFSIYPLHFLPRIRLIFVSHNPRFPGGMELNSSNHFVQ